MYAYLLKNIACAMYTILINFDVMHAGERFLYWYGTDAMICISDVELVKEILSNKFGFYPKRKVRRPSVVTLVGEGLALMEGEEWVRRRKILNPAFSMDKLKV
jgi:PHYB activation tagged suppressor 1